MSLLVTPGQLALRSELYHQLGALLTAGIPLINALEALHKNPPSRGFRQPVAVLLARLKQGTTFTEAMQATGRWIPAFDVALLSAGESSGRLEACFNLLAEYYRERAELARRVISDLGYPLLVLHVAILVFPVGLLTKLVWDFDIWPFLIQKLFVLGPLYGGVIALLYACQGRHGERWRSGIEAALHWVPILGKARRELALARMTSALEALLNAGVDVFDAWEMAAAASGSPALKRAVFAWRPQLENGRTPSEVLNETNEFPELFANLYYSGEISGQHDDALRRIHDYYQESSTRRFRALAEWTPRLIYFGIMFLIAWQIISFWTNYYGGMMRAIE
jgi:type II secretory pathway component PulF